MKGRRGGCRVAGLAAEEAIGYSAGRHRRANWTSGRRARTSSRIDGLLRRGSTRANDWGSCDFLYSCGGLGNLFCHAAGRAARGDSRAIRRCLAFDYAIKIT